MHLHGFVDVGRSENGGLTYRIKHTNRYGKRGNDYKPLDLVVPSDSLIYDHLCELVCRAGKNLFGWFDPSNG